MSGIELIGAVASASQLIRYTVNIITYTKDIIAFIKETSSQFQRHQESLESLISAVETIRQTPLLQTCSIRDHLALLSKRTEILGVTLKHYTPNAGKTLYRRVWRALLAHKVEAQILQGLTDLERDKSNLLLCITTFHGTVLHDISLRTNLDFETERKNLEMNNSRKIADTVAEGEHKQLSGSGDAGPVEREGEHPSDSREKKNGELATNNAIATYTLKGSRSSASATIQNSNPGDVFLGNDAIGLDSAVRNQKGESDQGATNRSDFFGANCARGPGSSVVNGAASSDDLKEWPNTTKHSGKGKKR